MSLRTLEPPPSLGFDKNIVIAKRRHKERPIFLRCENGRDHPSLASPDLRSKQALLCPRKGVVGSYLFRSANTGAKSSRRCKSMEGCEDLVSTNDEEVSLRIKDRHLPLRVAPAGAVRIGFGKLAHRQVWSLANPERD